MSEREFLKTLEICKEINDQTGFIISPDVFANVDCLVEFPYTLGPFESLNCTYQANLPDASTRTNTVTATFQNYSYAHDGSKIPYGTTDYSGSASVDFGAAVINEIDECAHIDDTMIGSLGTVCSYPATFSYSKWVGPYAQPGDYNIINTAILYTSDTGSIYSDDQMVTINVTSCILGGGYWKTHSKYGPAPYDETWSELTGVGEDILFYLSDQTYYEVLWTIPKGKIYYILAKEYISAVLNLINGAPINNEVLDAISEAEFLFNEYYPNEIHKRSPEKDYFLSLAQLLNNYNNGLVVPDRCSQAEPFETISHGKSSGSKIQPLEDDLEAKDKMVIKTYPNPFENVFAISVVSSRESNIELMLFDITGRQLINPVKKFLQAGQSFEFNFDAGQLNSSFIIYKLTRGKESKTGKLLRIQ